MKKPEFKSKAAGSRKPPRVLVLGAARSGKSRYAQRLAEKISRRPLFVATAEAVDREMEDRIKKHKLSRGRRWLCVEEPLEIASLIRKPPAGAGAILVDCLTVWLGNVLHKEGKRAFEGRKRALIAAFCGAPCPVILVANEVGMGIVPDSEMGRTFRGFAGWLNQALAAEADAVVLVVAGLPMSLKGRMEW